MPMQFTNGHIFVPFSKVDREKRIVWGVAQSEDPDCQDDLLDYAGSVRAFNAWSGNVREMHDRTKAVGKRIEVKYDPETKAVAVGTYISKGAEDTWQKVLDGTLAGYSIGGYPLKSKSIVKDGRRLQHITDYVLEELSLVDTPANPRCVITAIQKRGTHLVATDILGSARSPEGNKMRTRAKIGSLVAFAKGLADDDEVIVARKSDFLKAADGKLFVKPDAGIAHFAKADLDADGYDDSADDTAPDEPVSKADASGHAQNALDSHDDWHKVAGQSECNCDRDDDAPDIKGKSDAEAEDDTDAGDGEFGKNASRRRRRRNALRKNGRVLTKSDVELTLTSALAEFAKSFDEKFAKLGVGGDTTPRKNGDGDGTLVKRDANGDDDDPIAKNASRLTTLYTRRTELLKKGNRDLSTTDRAERDALSKEIGNAEIEQLALTGAQAR